VDAQLLCSRDTALAEVLRVAPGLPTLVEHAAHRVRETHGHFLPAVLDGVYADLFRAELSQALLVEYGIDSDECLMEPGNRNSVVLNLGEDPQVRLHVLKKTGTATPRAGSAARAAAYGAQDALFTDLPIPSVITLIWTWHIKRNGTVSQHLLMPKAAAEQDQHASCHWRIPVPDELSALENLRAHQDLGEDDDLEEIQLRRDDAADEDDPA
jgi:hypothetical protein